MNSNFPDLGAFRAWAKQNPSARRLLKEIIFRWRGSSARLRGDSAPWAAYPLARWRDWTGLTRSTLDRRLKDLADAGLIQRERHRFAGCTIYPWLRPTELALVYGGTTADLARLRPKKQTPANLSFEATTEAMHEAVPEPLAAAAHEATDYTSIPSSATPATEPQAPVNKFTEGKGKAGEKQDWIKEMAMKQLTALAKEEGEQDIDLSDPEWAGFIQSKMKKLEVLLAKFPRLKGPHEPYVKHPSEMHSKWSSWSLELIAKRQEVYEVYVANWYTGNGGKTPMTKKGSGLSQEEDAEIVAHYDKLVNDPAHAKKWWDGKKSTSGG